MQTRKASKNIALWKATENGDVEKVHELLKSKADPNYYEDDSLIENAMKLRHVPIVKLLIHYGANLKEDNGDWLEEMFKPENSLYTKELVEHIIKYSKDVDLIHDIFKELAASELDSPLALDILKLLLENGLPVNKYHRSTLWFEEEDSFTPFHLSVQRCRIDFVKLLLEHGADIHHKTRLGMNNIYLSAWHVDDELMKMFLDNKVQINERLLNGTTALHRTCGRPFPDSAYAMLKYGADPNVLDDDGNTPLMKVVYTDVALELIKVLAKLKYEDQFVCPENLEMILAFDILQQSFESCLNELQKMKNHEVWKGLSLYDILHRKNSKKLTFLMKNKNFVTAFESGWDRKMFKNYNNHLDDIFEDALEKRDILQSEEKKLYLILKDYLPELVISKVSYFMNEHLLFK